MNIKICSQCRKTIRRNEKGDWEHFHPSGETRHMMHVPEPRDSEIKLSFSTEPVPKNIKVLLK